MERGSFVTKRNAVFSIFSGTKLAEVLRCLGHDVGEQLDHDPANVRGSDSHVQEHDGVVRMSELGLDLGPAVDGRHYVVLFSEIIEVLVQHLVEDGSS